MSPEAVVRAAGRAMCGMCVSPAGAHQAETGARGAVSIGNDLHLILRTGKIDA